MAESQPKNLLKDLASAARKGHEARVMSPARAMRQGLARAAAQLWDLPLSVSDTRDSTIGLERVAEALPQQALMALLDGPDGARGAVALDRTLVTGLTEVQTLGLVTGAALSERALTPTDAAMVAPWLDAALERVDLTLHGAGVAELAGSGGPRDLSWMLGYRFGAMAEDGRALSLALDASEFHVLRLTVDLAEGKRSGTLVILLPAAVLPAPAKEDTPKDPQKTFLAVRTELTVIAGRLSMPLKKAGALKEGDVIPVDTLLLKAAELQALDGSNIGTARLGRVNGHWALRFGGDLAMGAAKAAAKSGGVVSEKQGAGVPTRNASAGAPTKQQPENEDEFPELPSLDFEPAAIRSETPVDNLEDIEIEGFD